MMITECLTGDDVLCIASNYAVLVLSRGEYLLCSVSLLSWLSH